MDTQKELTNCNNWILEQDDDFVTGYGQGNYALGLARLAWQAAKAQAVPEQQQELNDRLLVKSIREHVESHISEISVNDLFDKGWLAAMKCIQNNIDMLEAQEPKWLILLFGCFSS